ncbi:MAG: efflux transporter outer membrane subunit [Luteolibacter sp.]|uniref:efflux transporter outer membrane subunit n=1 Tax=Luteolibacter sp. TaxID=1962973 RepID=UPI003264F9FE
MLISTGCMVGPDYKQPNTDVPENYKSGSHGTWKEGRPLDHQAKGNWWKIFGDDALNGLQSRAAGANQEAKAAIARVDQARATARTARSELLPTLDANPSFTRQRLTSNEKSNGGVTVSGFRAPLDLSYEVDLWGRVRRGFESATADSQASVAAYHNVLLVLQTDVAQNYFALRSLDAEIEVTKNAIGLRKEQVQLVRSRFETGVGNELDLARTKADLDFAEAQIASLSKRRAELENALAILIGENPSTFTFAAASSDRLAKWDPAPPRIPAGLPADLLERRPDVSEAERQLAAANARIGVAKAAFFPSLSLTGSAGYVSADIGDMFNWDSPAWLIGPSVSLPIFAGGRNQANFKRSEAAYTETVALYRQRILVAFGEVESSLSTIRFLEEQAAAQNRAVVDSSRAAELAETRYRTGIVGHLEVLDANRDVLQAKQAKAQLSGQRLIASAQLIKALGGGW